MFLEEDFKLVENSTIVREQLINAVQLLGAGGMDVIKMRHRWQFGYREPVL